VEPNQQIVLDAIVRTPSVPGDYFLEFDLVQEFVAWFKDKGSQTVRIPVKIVHIPSIWPVETISILDDFVGMIDHIEFRRELGSLEVGGWIASRTHGLVESAAIYLDSTLLGPVRVGQPRIDVASATNPDFLLTGWSEKFRILPLRPGIHLAELYATAGLERSVVPHASQVISVDEDGTVSAVSQHSLRGLSVPPPDLIRLVAGTSDVDWFLRSGAMATWTIQEILSKVNKRIDDFRQILDFGCGCGRVILHLRHLNGLHGSDFNPILVEYCQGSLPFARFATNAAWPPLSYEDESFDLIYAFSVFTHMTVSQQREWMQELSRVLRKSGLLLITTCGKHYRRVLYGEHRRRFDAGCIVVHRPDVAGTSECMAYHPSESLSTLLPENLTIVNFTPEGAKGSSFQDVFLLMKM
jgi:SAM-dependent methyltransferase